MKQDHGDQIRHEVHTPTSVFHVTLSESLIWVPSSTWDKVPVLDGGLRSNGRHLPCKHEALSSNSVPQSTP
jgi:hypothetical protein